MAVKFSKHSNTTNMTYRTSRTLTFPKNNYNFPTTYRGKHRAIAAKCMRTYRAANGTTCSRASIYLTKNAKTKWLLRCVVLCCACNVIKLFITHCNAISRTAAFGWIGRKRACATECNIDNALFAQHTFSFNAS